MVSLYIEKDMCCGCSACKSICPQKAITMEPDENGFLFPHINTKLCVGCKLCNKVCAFQNHIHMDKRPLATFAALNKNKKVLEYSSSGGVFSALATIVINCGGIVFGCTMKQNQEIEHVYITNIDDLYKLQGSKYVQSDIKDTYSAAKEYLNKGRIVLYTGTPCQIDGLKYFLGKDYENLITADIICHGVPSPTFFKGYYHYLDSKINASIKEFKFRSKKSDGANCVGNIKYIKRGKVYSKDLRYTLDFYYNYFMYGVIARDSCFKCPYASSNRPSDFTMGDYWGIEEVHPEINTTNGISVLLVNTENGLKLINELNKYLDLVKSDFDSACEKNKNLCMPTPKNTNRELILQIFRENGAQAVAKYFEKSLGKKVIIYKIKAIIPNSYKKTFKLILKKLKNIRN